MQTKTEIDVEQGTTTKQRHLYRTSSLGVLTTHTQSPVVTETTVGSNLLQSFNIISELRFQVVRNDLAEFAILDILLSVEEIVGDVELARVSDDGDDLLDFIRCKFTSSAREPKHQCEPSHARTD
jgi:hypothetical protein